MRIRLVAVCCFLSMIPFGAAAQMNGGTQSPAIGSMATPVSAFDSQLSLIEGEMMGAVKAMPADKFAFAPSAAIFAPGQKDRIRYRYARSPSRQRTWQRRTISSTHIVTHQARRREVKGD